MKRFYFNRAICFKFAKLGTIALLVFGAENSYAQHGGGEKPHMEEYNRLRSNVPKKEKKKGREIDSKNFDMMPFYALFKRNEIKEVFATFTLKIPETDLNYDLTKQDPKSLPPTTSNYPDQLIVQNKDESAFCSYSIPSGACEYGESCMNYDPLSEKLVEQETVKLLGNRVKSLRPRSASTKDQFMAHYDYLNNSNTPKEIPESSDKIVNRIVLRLPGKAVLKDGKEVDTVIEVQCAFTGKFKGTNPKAVYPTVADVQELLKDFLTIEASVVKINN
jgi:hypothetical protein